MYVFSYEYPLSRYLCDLLIFNEEHVRYDDQMRFFKACSYVCRNLVPGPDLLHCVGDHGRLLLHGINLEFDGDSVGHVSRNIETNQVSYLKQALKDGETPSNRETCCNSS